VVIRDTVADQIDAANVAYGWHLDQGVFHGWIAEGVPLLKPVNPQHCGKLIGMPPALLAGFGVEGLK
jgi:hypothetical protein